MTSLKKGIENKEERKYSKRKWLRNFQELISGTIINIIKYLCCIAIGNSMFNYLSEFNSHGKGRVNSGIRVTDFKSAFCKTWKIF